MRDIELASFVAPCINAKHWLLAVGASREIFFLPFVTLSASNAFLDVLTGLLACSVPSGWTSPASVLAMGKEGRRLTLFRLSHIRDYVPTECRPSAVVMLPYSVLVSTLFVSISRKLLSDWYQLAKPAAVSVLVQLGGLTEASVTML